MLTLKQQLEQGLSAFGVKLPSQFPIDEWTAKLGDSPARNTAAVVAMSSLLFYAVERIIFEVNDVFDASIYCSTCLSVGYGDIFAKTPLGKLIGTMLMTIGPSLSNAAMDGPRMRSSATPGTNAGDDEGNSDAASATGDDRIGLRQVRRPRSPFCPRRFAPRDVIPTFTSRISSSLVRNPLGDRSIGLYIGRH